MHRLAAVPGVSDHASAGAFVEQPAAPILMLSSADTDLVAIDRLLDARPELLGQSLRGLNLAALAHPAIIDHYIATTAASARLVVVRLLGGRGHWSYGLEQLQHWASRVPGRHLLVLAGTPSEDIALAELGTLPLALSLALAECFRQGGAANLALALGCFRALLDGENPAPPAVIPLGDPLPHDWRDERGARVGVIAYRALLQAGDTDLVEAIERG